MEQKKTRDGGAISLIKIIVKRVRYKDDEMEWNVRRENGEKKQLSSITLWYNDAITSSL